jgi:hypothetical protein
LNFSRYASRSEHLANGLDLNVIFLSEALQSCHSAKASRLSTRAAGTQCHRKSISRQKACASCASGEAADAADVIFEMSSALDPQWLDLVRACQEGCVTFAVSGTPVSWRRTFSTSRSTYSALITEMAYRERFE